MADQTSLDARNSAFWDELCGTGLAQALGIRSDDPEALRRFDDGYFALYPYLRQYVDRLDPAGKRVLEVGLGYGTLSQCLAEQGAEYFGLDIAEGPVRMVRHRMQLLGRATAHVHTGSVLQAPFADASFDAVISIGCLHHTGDLPRAVAETRRLLRPGGQAIVMLYNRHSFRQLVQAPLVRLRARRSAADEAIRGMYDVNQAGQAAPHTDYVSRREARRLFDGFRQIEIDSQNFDPVVVRGRILVPRERLLRSAGRMLGLDLYITARK